MQFAIFLKRIIKTVYLQVGDWILSVNSYLNFDRTSGASGHGIRSNSGVMQYKNQGDSWRNIGSGGSGGVVNWGDIEGTLANQGDLQDALDAKQDKMVYDDDIGSFLINN